jgi:predicted MPP superfamily phosphohydrolase
MIAILLAPFYLLLNFYLALRTLRWIATLHSFSGSVFFLVPFWICCALIAVSPLPAAFGRGRLKIAFKKLSSWWLGTLIYFVFFLLLSDLVKALLRLYQHQPLLADSDASVIRISGILVGLGTLLLSWYGDWNARNLRRTVYEVTIQKDCPVPSLKIALLADLHLGGASGLAHIRKVCAAVNKMKPDLLILAGDIFDNDFSAIDDPARICAAFRGIQTKYGSYACWGNHDIEEIILAGFTFHNKGNPVSSSPEMNQFLKDAGICLLTDETVLIDNAFYLCGRLDASCREKSGMIRLTPEQLTAGLDSSKPILVIDHQPSELDELAAAGVDLDLSGHTHDGQIFPLNLTTSLLWANSKGHKKVRHMSSIVTAGAGTWGPSQRIATHSEVVEVRVAFS